ncbi:MAG: hypothetical protein M1819_006854 [Sarea resinae]|nr:MAG: hypothetical protein M1819_006854 [Sarea resinae]
MVLVDYSDSESSSDETDLKTGSQPPRPPSSSKPTTTKPTFQKVVDRSSHKIRVNLPKATKEEHPEDAEDHDDRPAKRARTAAGGGFNSFLPAPKKQAPASASQGQISAKRGIGSGISLKTGAAPAFNREPEPGPEDQVAEVEEDYSGWNEERPTSGEAEQKITTPDTASSGNKLSEDVKKSAGTPMMFKPLSVARKPGQKKKKPVSNSTNDHINSTSTVPTTAGATNPTPSTKPPPKKVSLFSLSADQPTSNIPSTSAATSEPYTPLLYTPTPDPTTSQAPLEDAAADPDTFSAPPEPTTTTTSSQPTLSTLAQDLHLPPAAMRQLFGRQSRANANAPAQDNAKIITFNTDAEYAANEALRAAGETVQHNPVRAIAPGKHSLKQLVSAASNQKEALEEQFASGRRNKKEAGGRYGW